MAKEKKTSASHAAGSDKDSGSAAQPKEGSTSNRQGASSHLNPSAPEDANTTPGTTTPK